MPKVDTAYIIGVIREKEKGLLEEDEYTRIIQAPSGQDAVRVLVDTPYGIHLEQTGSVFEAVTAHLTDEMNWLREMIDNEDVITFLTARYDGLHIGRALMKYRAGQPKPGHVASPSSLSHPLLSSVIWDNEGAEDLPAAWREFLQQELALLRDNEDWTTSDMLQRIGKHVVSIMKQTATGDLMDSIAALAEQRHALEASVRPLTIEYDKGTASAPSWLPAEVLEDVAAGRTATAYERAWDTQIIELIREQRSNPVGYDPIVAYWYAKTIEAHTVRLLLSAKLGGLTAAQLQHLKRPLYLATT